MTTKNVPLEPTEAMLKAAQDVPGDYWNDADITRNIWAAMVEASPPSGGEVVYQWREIGERNWHESPSIDYFNSRRDDDECETRTLYTSPRVVGEAMVLRAARVLSNRAAQECNFDPDDNWNFYSETYITDAELALQAALGEGK